MLISAVTDAGHGLHVDEAAALLSARGRNVAELGGAAFLSALARRYGGLAMTRSRYFVLPEWADERRTTPRQALNAILDENAHKSSAQLAELVSASCNRPVDKAQVLSILGDLGYGFDSGLGRWVLVEDQG